ncbi:VOC family protein [Sphingomonas cannabina]|uniref:VOC family protein n=1 Tax=Sphingomonas cannabina TaxID=2899123 RepID=UPI001F268161|nr:VOC family protein [Sphingomonas cannabina]UIJ45616.1 VOC family protein [Sphingomonas cannabina]
MSIAAHPFLMFQGEAAAALALYEASIPGARVERSADGTESGGEAAVATLVVGDLAVRVFDSPVKHAFTFTPSFSLFLDFTGEEELRAVADALGEGGQVLMPLDSYDFGPLFTWLVDRFGVSWQLNLLR